MPILLPGTLLNTFIASCSSWNPPIRVPSPAISSSRRDVVLVEASAPGVVTSVLVMTLVVRNVFKNGTGHETRLA